MIQKLRLKFILVNMSIVAAMLTVIFSIMLHTTRRSLELQSQQMIQHVMDRDWDQLSRPGDGRGQIQLPFFRVRINAFGEVSGITGGYFDLSDRQELEQIISAALSEQQDFGLLSQYSLRYGRRSSPFGQVIVFVDISSERATLRSLLMISVVIGLLTLGAFLPLSLLLSKWAVGPVERAWQQQRQFVADASHELKTPLTVIMTNAELLSTGQEPPEEQARCVSSILSMSQQMRTLVLRLLELARVDSGASSRDFTVLDLSELAEEALLPFEPVYFEQGLTLESSIAPGLHVRGSGAHLKQVMDILLDNGAKYSAAPGRVFWKLQHQGGSCLLSIATPGPAISREDQKNIFKRFYRIDQARGGSSYGLGLSIAWQIAADHRGKLWADSAGGYNTFYFQLPAVR